MAGVEAAMAVAKEGSMDGRENIVMDQRHWLETIGGALLANLW